MPKALAGSDTERKELKNAPPDGFVVLRRMNYGQVLKSRSLVSKMESPKDQGSQMEMTMSFDSQAIYDFKTSIVEHNLTDDDDKPLNFNNADHVMKLDPKVAQEIEKYIAELNNPESSTPLA